jgi:hypothetical protein
MCREESKSRKFRSVGLHTKTLVRGVRTVENECEIAPTNDTVNDCAIDF